MNNEFRFAFATNCAQHTIRCQGVLPRRVELVSTKKIGRGECCTRIGRNFSLSLRSSTFRSVDGISVRFANVCLDNKGSTSYSIWTGAEDRRWSRRTKGCTDDGLKWMWCQHCKFRLAVTTRQFALFRNLLVVYNQCKWRDSVKCRLRSAQYNFHR